MCVGAGVGVSSESAYANAWVKKKSWNPGENGRDSLASCAKEGQGQRHRVRKEGPLSMSSHTPRRPSAFKNIYVIS